MNDLPEGLAYLATPYTRYTGGIEAAFKDAAKLAARLLCTGLKVYSPICHTHPIAIYGALDALDHSIWLPFDEDMMEVSATLIVAHMDGWDESRGVAHEIKFFENAGKPIFDLDPATLNMVQRREGHLDVSALFDRGSALEPGAVSEGLYRRNVLGEW
jgi:hypothetical protein